MICRLRSNIVVNTGSTITFVRSLPRLSENGETTTSWRGFVPFVKVRQYIMTFFPELLSASLLATISVKPYYLFQVLTPIWHRNCSTKTWPHWDRSRAPGRFLVKTYPGQNVPESKRTQVKTYPGQNVPGYVLTGQNVPTLKYHNPPTDGTASMWQWAFLIDGITIKII